MVAGCVAFLGVILSWYLGTTQLGLSTFTILLGILVSNGAGMTALLSTLKLERTAWVRTNILRGPIQTWTYFLTVYFGLLIGLFPPLQESQGFALLVLPLIFTTGFTILAFGPLQDGIIAREQRRFRLRVGITR